MASITLRIIDGADRGKSYANLSTPVSIGREAGNSIQLNDDRVSRFHLKINIDRDNFVLTDLESTNGTIVNGEETSVKILRYGDVVRVGRSAILVGTREQINQRLEKIGCSDLGKQLAAQSSSDSNAPQPWNHDPNYQLRLMEGEPPPVPSRMSPGQAAQFIEVMEFMHLQMRKLITEIEPSNPNQPIEISLDQWQMLLDIRARLAEYIRMTGKPSV